jgi:hypothetical protein
MVAAPDLSRVGARHRPANPVGASSAREGAIRVTSKCLPAAPALSRASFAPTGQAVAAVQVSAGDAIDLDAEFFQAVPEAAFADA